MLRTGDLQRKVVTSRGFKRKVTTSRVLRESAEVVTSREEWMFWEKMIRDPGLASRILPQSPLQAECYSCEPLKMLPVLAFSSRCQCFKNITVYQRALTVAAIGAVASKMLPRRPCTVTNIPFQDCYRLCCFKNVTAVTASRMCLRHCALPRTPLPLIKIFIVSNLVSKGEKSRYQSNKIALKPVILTFTVFKR